MSSQYITPINNFLEEPKVSNLGGKGASLIKLVKGGFPVPDGFIITTSGYDVFSDGLHLHDLYLDITNQESISMEQAESLSGDIKELFERSEFPAEYIEEIKTLLDDMKSHPIGKVNLLAIRSSAITEDLADASFAGMQDTILNVPIEFEAVIKAVKQCWASLYTPRAILYRFEKHFPVIDTSIAVVVQRMIPSEKSGVIFSSDPQTSSREHISLDGVWGLGEALVSGLVSTDHWSIRKHYPIDKKHTELKIVSRTINNQQFAFYTKPGGGTDKVDLNEKGKEACFTDEEIYGISEYAVNIEDYYSKPMDIEFCICDNHIYIVQARPITTLFDLPDDLNPLVKNIKHPYVNMICFNNIQMILKPISYGGTTAFNRLIFKEFSLFRWISGFVYLNIMPLLAVSRFRNLFVNIFGSNVDKEIARISNEYIISDFLPMFSSSYKIPIFSLIKGFIQIIPSFIGKLIYYYVFGVRPTTIYAAIQNNLNEIMNYYNEYLKDIDKKIETKELTLAQYSNRKYTILSLLKKIIPFFVISFKCNSIVKDILKKNNIDENELQVMCSGRVENIASQMDEEVTQLHCSLLECSSEDTQFMSNLNNYLEIEDEEGLKGFLNSLKDSSYVSQRHFYERYKNFMERFGRRGPGEIDIANERYADKPSILLKTVLNTSYTNSENKSSSVVSQKADAKVDEICSKLPPKDAAKLRQYLPVARLVFTYREHPKYIIISSLYIDRKFYLFYGKQMKEQHLIEDVHDVFHFSYDELLQYEKGTLDFKSIKSEFLRRKMFYQKNQNILPPRVICTPYGVLSSVSDQTRKELDSLPANTMSGMPTSSGVVEGKAVVVTDPREGHLKNGDILVAPATDPGWTPLFIPAGGVVIEVGGPLTHGSIVAREMGIPCVVNIPNLLSRIKTGMTIRVDGGKGTVEILDE